jgi:hypothetical protein
LLAISNAQSESDETRHYGNGTERADVHVGSIEDGNCTRGDDDGSDDRE